MVRSACSSRWTSPNRPPPDATARCRSAWAWWVSATRKARVSARATWAATCWPGHPFDPARLALTDARGITLAQAIRDFGGDPDTLAADRLDPAAEDGLLGYVEVHIEQGPVLEAHNLPVGIVSAIAGQSRFTFRFEGQAGHAGTTPMRLRRDALAAAAQFINMVEDHALREDGLVATVGQLEVRPGAGNVIPGSVTGSLDVRSPHDAQRLAACEDLHALRRAGRPFPGPHAGLAARPDPRRHAARSCPPRPSRRRRPGRRIFRPRTPQRRGPRRRGARPVMPAAMLFVRCRDGLSHHPLESVAAEDVASALKVMDNFLVFSHNRRSLRTPPFFPVYMSDFDLIIRGGSVVRPDGVAKLDLGIKDGIITALGNAVFGSTDSDLDASDFHIFPGGVDPHVHFNEPGRTDWEGFDHGTRALAAGGVTSFFDMPLNAQPPVLDKGGFLAKWNFRQGQLASSISASGAA